MTSVYLPSEFVVMECGAEGCDQAFAVTRRFFDWTHEGHGWHCPRGHSRIWKGKTTRQQLEAAQTREQQLRDQLHAAEADAEAVRVRLLRDRARIANGVCPCCNRSLTALMQHMRSQHPDFDPGDVTTTGFRCSCGRKFGTLRGLRIHQGVSRPDDWQSPSMSKYRRHLTVTS